MRLLIAVSISLSLALTVSLALTAGCSTGGAERVGRGDCERLRDHLVDVRMASVTADHEQHRRAIRTALGDGFLSSCLDLTTESQLRCSLKANDAQALTACARQ